MEVSARRSGAILAPSAISLRPHEIFRRGVDRLDRRDGAIAQVEDGEFARFGIAPDHKVIRRPR